MLTGDYMKAKECFHDAVSIQQAHQPRLEMLELHLKLNETKLEIIILLSVSELGTMCPVSPAC